MYTIPISSFYTLLIHDAPARRDAIDAGHKSGNQVILEEYIIEAHAILSKNISSLIDFKKSFAEKDEKRLTTMVTLAVDARKTWEAEVADGNFVK